MSGTSLDGIDVALVRTDGRGAVAMVAAHGVPLTADVRAAVRGVLGAETRDAKVRAVEDAITAAHVGAVIAARKAWGDAVPWPPALIGFHGQTLSHAPKRKHTLQVGDGSALAAALSVPVVFDMRSADVAAGGQGAPLVPLFHAAVVRAAVAAGQLPAEPVAVLNVGGVANVTYVAPDGSLLAFDVGPGGALVDDAVAAAGAGSMDKDGALAATGTVQETAVCAFLEEGFFAASPPKSLDRGSLAAAATASTQGLPLADAVATLTEMTARAVGAAVQHLPAVPASWLVTGGGRHNTTLMQRLAAALPGATVQPVETLGWDGDALEAAAFAYLAVRSQAGLPLTLPSTTGVPQPTCGGVMAAPPSQHG